jgi:hypothetical protein
VLKIPVANKCAALELCGDVGLFQMMNDVAMLAVLEGVCLA